MTASALPAFASAPLASTSKPTFSLSQNNSVSPQVPTAHPTRDHTPPTGRHRSVRKARTSGTSPLATRSSRRSGDRSGENDGFPSIKDSGDITFGAVARQADETVLDPFQLAPLSTALQSFEDNNRLPSCEFNLQSLHSRSDRRSRRLANIRALELNSGRSAKRGQKKVKASFQVFLLPVKDKSGLAASFEQDLPNEIVIKVFEFCQSHFLRRW